MGDRRNTELLLLLAGAVPVFLLYGMYLAQQGTALTWQAFIVPIGLTVAFTIAHVAVRIFARGADPAILPIVLVLSGIGIARLVAGTAVRSLPRLLSTGVISKLKLSSVHSLPTSCLTTKIFASSVAL